MVQNPSMFTSRHTTTSSSTTEGHARARMSVLRLPYEPRRAPRKAILDEGLVAIILLHLAERDWLIIDPMAGERTIEKVGRRLGYTIISSDIREGVDARQLTFLQDCSVDMVFTHPPYWKATRYSDNPRDLSNARTYEDYIEGLSECMREFHRVLKPKGRVVLVIGDYRRKKRLYPIHADVIVEARKIGFDLKAIWIHEVSASGTPFIGTEFMMGHDYILVFEKS